jgi:pyruvate/2-oxoglutarate dehydrogenase complex dihydrolipoamide dehydrogenase (E3) component
MQKNYTEKFNAIIIGAGQSGKPLALAFGDRGLKTAIIEMKYVGGKCINYGCTPTKTMIASAKIAQLARDSGKYGVSAGKVKVNFRKVIERKNEIVKSFRDSGRKRLQKHERVELIFGEASFKNEHVLEVKQKRGGVRELTADKIFINTGTLPFIPRIEGLDKTGYLTSTTILDMDELPKHLIIIGGGYVGLEFAQMFRRFGSRVTIIQKNKRLAPNEDDDICSEIFKIITEEGIDVLLNSRPKRISKDNKGKISVEFVQDNEEKSVKGSHLLIAAGLVPNTSKLNLESAGIKTDLSGFIKVNDKLETGTEGIYALGDVNGEPAFTHISYDDYRIVNGNLLENKNLSRADRLVPYTLFIDPPLGRVGLNEKDAEAKNIKFKTFKYPMDYVARAIETGETGGFMKAVVDTDTGQILGCSILGNQGGEIMSMIEIAMLGKIQYTVLRDAIFAHPLLSESLNSLFTDY